MLMAKWVNAKSANITLILHFYLVSFLARVSSNDVITRSDRTVCLCVCLSIALVIHPKTIQDIEINFPPYINLKTVRNSCIMDFRLELN